MKRLMAALFLLMLSIQVLPVKELGSWLASGSANEEIVVTIWDVDIKSQPVEPFKLLVYTSQPFCMVIQRLFIPHKQALFCSVVGDIFSPPPNA